MPHVLTVFEPDAGRLAVMKECTERYDVGDANAEWPNNILSCRTVVYETGRIARAGDPVSHCVDADELKLCQELAKSAEALMEGTDVGMGSEGGDPFRGFYIVANTDEQKVNAITKELIVEKFAGTIFPTAPITVEPLQAQGQWWAEVLEDSDGMGDEYLAPWRRMIEWFNSCKEFVDCVFVRIGDYEMACELDNAHWPEGTVMPGCVMPRLALGLTKASSLTGLFGYSVQT